MLVEDSDDTTRLQPMIPLPDEMYVAQVVYEFKLNNKWLMHFIVAKDHVALLEVSVPITYPIMIVIIIVY